jgi:hypothetical protein
LVVTAEITSVFATWGPRPYLQWSHTRRGMKKA